MIRRGVLSVAVAISTVMLAGCTAQAASPVATAPSNTASVVPSSDASSSGVPTAQTLSPGSSSQAPSFAELATGSLKGTPLCDSWISFTELAPPVDRSDPTLPDAITHLKDAESLASADVKPIVESVLALYQRASAGEIALPFTLQQPDFREAVKLISKLITACTDNKMGDIQE